MPLLTPVTTNTLLVSLSINIEAFVFDDLESGWSGIAGAFGIYLYELQRSGICYGHGIDWSPQKRPLDAAYKEVTKTIKRII